MRKADYALLAEAIKKRRDDALGMVVIGKSHDYHQGQADALHQLAQTFARFAHVDKTEFLKACGIENS